MAKTIGTKLHVACNLRGSFSCSFTRDGDGVSPELRWVLLYTKQHAEEWAEINLRKQGFSTLLPRVRSRGALAPLFPRYLFAGHSESRTPRVMHSTFGVMYTVSFGDGAARVPDEVIAEIRSRMDAHGVVALEAREREDPLFARRQRDRIRTLEKFAAAGFRVRAA